MKKNDLQIVNHYIWTICDYLQWLFFDYFDFCCCCCCSLKNIQTTAAQHNFFCQLFLHVFLNLILQLAPFNISNIDDLVYGQVVHILWCLALEGAAAVGMWSLFPLASSTLLPCLPRHCRAEVHRSFITTTVWDESQVTPQGCHW